MSTQLTLDALDREFSEQKELPMQAAETPTCRFVTGTHCTIADLSSGARDLVSAFFSDNPDTVSLVVNNPMNRHDHSPKKRGAWEVLAFRKGGLQDAKDILLRQRSSVAASVEAVLESSLPGWRV